MSEQMDHDDALGTIRGAAEDVLELWDRIYGRLNGGDIPWNAASDIQGEFGGDFREIAKQLRAAEKALSLPPSAGEKGTPR